MGNRNTAPTPPVKDLMDDIGGAIARRRFTFNGRTVLPKTVLSAGEVMSMPGANRRAMIDNGYISIYPRSARPSIQADADYVPVERHMVNLGFGAFDVVEGKKLNSRPLNKTEAQDLIKQLGLSDPVVTESAVSADDGNSVPVENNTITTVAEAEIIGAQS